jgi:hypothetical protein
MERRLAAIILRSNAGRPVAGVRIGGLASHPLKLPLMERRILSMTRR